MLDWLTRLRDTRKSRAAAVTLLTVAAVGQAVTPGGSGADHQAAGAVGLAAHYVLLSLLAMLATVPLAVYGPVMGAVAATFANGTALIAFGQVTVAGVAAELVAGYWLGRTGGLDRAWVPRRLGRSGSAATPGRYLAVGLGVPFGGIALAGGGAAAVLLAALVPVASGLGIVRWAGRLAQTRTEAGEALANTLLAHTAQGERARIARELHDVVAHHISMIAVLSETGRLATPGLPEAGARRFLEIGDTARAGLTEMRRLLGVLREDAAGGQAGGPGEPDGPSVASARDAGGGVVAGDQARADGAARASREPQPGLAQVLELVNEARETSKAGTRLIMSGPVTPLDPGVELAAYRIVQEALTNARRHARGAAVDVELHYGQQALRVRVRDNGPGPVMAQAAPEITAGGGHPGDAQDAPGPGLRPPASGRAGGGHGLLGMRERAFSVGGALYVGAAPGGGFLVEAVLPTEADAVLAPGAVMTAGTAGTTAGPGGER